MATLQAFIRDESGATVIEYGLIAGIIACLAISGMRRVGTGLFSRFGSIANNLT